MEDLGFGTETWCTQASAKHPTPWPHMRTNHGRKPGATVELHVHDPFLRTLSPKPFGGFRV